VPLPKKYIKYIMILTNYMKQKPIGDKLAKKLPAFTELEVSL
jgi:hypothetical protein